MVSAGTRRVYGSYWNQILEHWADRRLDEPTALEIKQLAEHVRTHVVPRRNARGGRGVAEHLIAALRCVYNHAVADGWIAEGDNPAKRVPKPRRLNSEMSSGSGGVSAIKFDADGNITSAYRILSGTTRNCAGGHTPWNTWVSCEETDLGYNFETDPWGTKAAVRRDAMGRFKHEAIACDPDRKVIYQTEDTTDGCFYRFIPTSWGDLSSGTLQVLVENGTTLSWVNVPDPDGSPVLTPRPGRRRQDLQRR